MSARESIIQELKLAPESLVREAYDYVLFFKSRHGKEATGTKDTPFSAPMPDFEARQKKVFGGREVPDSQTLLDELRAERF